MSLRSLITEKELAEKTIQEKVEHYKNNVDELQLKLSELNSDKVNEDEKLEQQKDLCRSLEEQLSVQTAEWKSQQTALEEKVQQIEALEEKLNNASEKSKELHQKLKDTKDKSTVLEDQVQQLEEVSA